MIRRHITSRLLEALRRAPVVLLQGARQTGKSTLVRWLAGGRRRAEYLTLDDAATQAAAQRDPAGFLSGFAGPIILDEVQKVPELLPAIKIAVDRDRRPGRFLLTGSANVLTLPRISESLAGRMEVHVLWSLSQGELEGRIDRFVDLMFGERLPPLAPSRLPRDRFVQILLRGGFPEPAGRVDDAGRAAWFRSYVSTILQRDVRDLAAVEGLSELPRLLTLLAARTGGLLNFADVSRGLAIPQSTLKRYFALLTATYLVITVPPWFGNLGTRLVKSPKLYLADTGMLAHELGYDRERVHMTPAVMGTLMENFVVMELLKQATWSDVQPGLFHFRTHGDVEVDIVLEDRAGRIVGLEVKAAETLGRHDVKSLEYLAAAVGPRFHRGLVLYTGAHVIPFGPRLHAVPVSALWRMRSPAPRGRKK